MIIGHGGNIYKLAKDLGVTPGEITDMSSNLNPLGPPEGLMEHLASKLSTIVSLPEVDAGHIKELLAAKYGISPSTLLAGNGTTEFIYAIPRALDTKRALIVGPTYADYRDACEMYGAGADFLTTQKENAFCIDPQDIAKAADGYDTVFLCNPNNPTGTLVAPEAIKAMAEARPDIRFVIDESYLPFACDAYGKSVARYGLANVVVLNSMSKVFRIPGLRVGFLMAPEALIAEFSKYVLPWCVNAMAQAAVSFILSGGEAIDAFLTATRAYVKEEKERFVAALDKMPGIIPYGAETYFVICELQGENTAAALWTALAEEAFLIRDCTNFIGIEGEFVRFSLKNKETNDRLLTLLEKHLKK
ncbi:threonine-phosphate decarboxylase [Desulfoluna sp.]|uniref:threonine-phosphate decarboxylase n=1 Tax=Desulfoluna sp. TaxID=2045199 RepID=UPI00262D341B|nr:threonine-phosphate decarboxylase [Desulfoluna sp.]